ncbi:MAG: MFS transporter [Deltaproteobacteria bacterium]|nr:MFS transporter [Deltaproteobacteria bacterium]
MRHSWIPASATADSRRLIATRALRGFADGLVSILLPSYLTALGLSITQIGIILFGTLLGSALVTLCAGLAANRVGYRRLLLGACVMMLMTGLLFSYVRTFWLLLVAAFIGTLNPSAGDVSLFLPLEQASLAGTVTATDLTRIFAIYNVAGALAGAFGALFSGLPTMAAMRLKVSTIAAQRCVFIIYSVIALIAAVMYSSLSLRIEGEPSPIRTGPLTKSRGIVIHLAALFSLDAFSGGLIVQSLLALWLFHRFRMSAEAVGMFFFVSNLLGSASQFVSSALAARIGRIRTMVYTHLPSNGFLFLAALMPNEALTIVFLLLRSSLSQMDVPARQSYVMAMVPPEERAAAASVTNVPRSLASALGPIPAGLMLDRSTFGWPLICAAALKAAYDLLLLLQFGSVSPVDELTADVSLIKENSQ